MNRLQLHSACITSRSMLCRTVDEKRTLLSLGIVLCHVSLDSWLINQTFLSFYHLNVCLMPQLGSDRANFTVCWRNFAHRANGIRSICANWMRKLKFIGWALKLNRLLQRLTIKISFDCSLKPSRPNTCNVAQNNNLKSFNSFDQNRPKALTSFMQSDTMKIKFCKFFSSPTFFILVCSLFYYGLNFAKLLCCWPKNLIPTNKTAAATINSLSTRRWRFYFAEVGRRRVEKIFGTLCAWKWCRWLIEFSRYMHLSDNPLSRQ